MKTTKWEREARRFGDLMETLEFFCANSLAWSSEASKRSLIDQIDSFRLDKNDIVNFRRFGLAKGDLDLATTVNLILEDD